MSTPAISSSSRSLFTLAQKIFIVKCYYRGSESPRYVYGCLERRYGRIFAKKDILRSIQEIASLFEKTGSLISPVYYNGIEDGQVVVKEIKQEVPKVGQIVELPDDYLIEYVKEKEWKQTDQVLAGAELLVAVAEKGELYKEVIFESDDILVEEEETISDSHYTASPQPAADNEDGELIIEDKHPGNVRLCTECGETVPSKYYSIHKRNHVRSESPGSYDCPECGKSLVSRMGLKKHMKLHEPVTSHYVCEICGKVSRANATHVNHMKIHSDEKPYQCNQCPMAFKRLQGLRRHTMSHSGEKPLKCEVCGAAFLAHMTLSMHMRLHTGERPYECEHCGKRFIGRPSLNSHLKQQHGEEYSHVCAHCGGRFKTEKSKEQHMLKKHSIPIPKTEVPVAFYE